MANLESNASAFEVNLVSPEVEILVREDLSDLLKERLEEGVDSLLRRVHRAHEAVLLSATIVAPASGKTSKKLWVSNPCEKNHIADLILFWRPFGNIYLHIKRVKRPSRNIPFRHYII